MVAAALACACAARVGPRTIPRDRFDYGSAVQRSWRRDYGPGMEPRSNGSTNGLIDGDLRYVRYEVDSLIATITLDRADKANSQNERMLDELEACFTSAEYDDDVRVIVLRAEGKHFSAGHDLTVPHEDQPHRNRSSISVTPWSLAATRYRGVIVSRRRRPRSLPGSMSPMGHVDHACWPMA